MNSMSSKKDQKYKKLLIVCTGIVVFFLLVLMSIISPQSVSFTNPSPTPSPVPVRNSSKELEEIVQKFYEDYRMVLETNKKQGGITDPTTDFLKNHAEYTTKDFATVTDKKVLLCVDDTPVKVSTRTITVYPTFAYLGVMVEFASRKVDIRVQTIREKNTWKLYRVSCPLE